MGACLAQKHCASLGLGRGGKRGGTGGWAGQETDIARRAAQNHQGMSPGASVCHGSAVPYLLFWKSAEDQCLASSCLHQPVLDPNKS